MDNRPIILGGPKASILQDGKVYIIKYWGLPRPITVVKTLEDAIEEYNLENGTKAVLGKKEEKKYYSQEVPSNTTPGVVYQVKGTLDSLTCTCPGFSFRRRCWHANAVKALIEGSDTVEEV